MGWGRMLLLGNIGQQLDIQDNEQSMAQLRAAVQHTGQADADLARRLDQLAAENAELKLYLAAVVRLLVSKGHISDPELRRIVDLLDRADGQGDGKYSGPIPPA